MSNLQKSFVDPVDMCRSIVLLLVVVATSSAMILWTEVLFCGGSDPHSILVCVEISNGITLFSDVLFES